MVAISLLRGVLLRDEIKVEYQAAELSRESQKIVVDIEGAVQKPGVYEMEVGSRLKDLLVLAGGYAEKADRVYSQKNLNLAEVVKDEEKIYIPFESDTTVGSGYAEAKSGQNKININTSSETELDTLVGIGSVKAGNIVKNRPYKTLEEMVTKKVITKKNLEDNKDRMTVY